MDRGQQFDWSTASYCMYQAVKHLTAWHLSIIASINVSTLAIHTAVVLLWDQMTQRTHWWPMTLWLIQRFSFFECLLVVHGCTVVGSQHCHITARGFFVRLPAGAFSCEVCMFALCVHRFSLGAPASSDYPKTYVTFNVDSKFDPWSKCECGRDGRVMDWRSVMFEMLCPASQLAHFSC